MRAASSPITDPHIALGKILSLLLSYLRSSGTYCTMTVKKASPGLSVTPQPPKKELQFLYARRTAIDTLIQSLEQYDRFRAKAEEIRKLKTA